MRALPLAFLVMLAADVTPRGADIVETRWEPGDFVTAASESLDRLVNSGDAVGIRISGRGESCLFRRQTFPFTSKSRLRFRMRWSDAQFGHAYPSVHVLFNPPGLDDAWWKEPMADGNWAGRVKSFLFHFSTDPAWRLCGLTQSFESAGGRHSYCSLQDAWIDVEIRFDRNAADILVDGKKVGGCEVDLKGVRTFTYGIGDQTSTFVELDEFRFVSGR